MRKEEVLLLAAEDALKAARKEHNEAMTALERAYGKGVVTEPFAKAEIAARHKLMEIERLYEKRKNAVLYADAITDDEVDAIVATIVGNNQEDRQKELSDEDEGFCKMVLNNM